MTMNKSTDPDLLRALCVHAICIDLRLPSSDAKLFTYISFKADHSGQGCEYFNRPQVADVTAIQLLLSGQRRDSIVRQLSQRHASLARQFERVLISPELTRIDQQAKEKFGLEFPLRYELENRLRLHQDPVFRQTKLRAYQAWIAPQLADYNSDKVSAAFRHERKRNSDFNKFLNQIVNRP